MATIRNNAVIAAACNQRIVALKSHVSAKTPLIMNGVSYKQADILAVFQGVLDSQAALIKSRAQAKKDLVTRNAADLKRDGIEPLLKNWVLNNLGADSNAASEFGYAAPKKGKRTAETNLNGVRLNAATREARGTMGKKERLKIKGVLPTASAAPTTNTTAPVAVHTAPVATAAPTGGAPPTGAGGQ
jgi:hypothetical protein